MKTTELQHMSTVATYDGYMLHAVTDSDYITDISYLQSKYADGDYLRTNGLIDIDGLGFDIERYYGIMLGEDALWTIYDSLEGMSKDETVNDVLTILNVLAVETDDILYTSVWHDNTNYIFKECELDVFMNRESDINE